jgi:hypothetical protein
MGAGQRQQAIRVMRGQMWSPGRPSAARREDRVRFWEAIARGVSSEDAAAVAGVSQAVGSRWFRQAGGMPPITLAPLSGRYLSFAEREEIALFARATARGARDRSPGGPLAVDDLAGTAPQRVNAQSLGDLPDDDRALACRTARQPAQGGQARRESGAA